MSEPSPLLAGTPYVSYAYSYPHKTAYRMLPAPAPLSAVWARERREALFLYLHVPLCEMRCGFCNLFTLAQPKEDLVGPYLAALTRQASAVREALGGARFARLAIGGGTPTYLEVGELEALFTLAERLFGASPRDIPCSVETSPETATPEKLALLRGYGVSRVSIGVQSFLESETAALGRPQRTASVLAALSRLRGAGFPTLNIDLIYGVQGQTVASWLESIRAALRFSPEELYLYPLYVRPLTGLGKRGRAATDLRLECYREGRALLLSAGYRQLSMRMFRANNAPAESGPVYRCQEDGMVGLGCGARSYTAALHYSDEYAVGRQGVREILAAYLSRPDEELTRAYYGYALDAEDQRRRYAILSLLSEGLSLAEYRARFGAEPFSDLPELGSLAPLGLAAEDGGRLALTPLGLERSDVIGPWLASRRARERMGGYELR